MNPAGVDVEKRGPGTLALRPVQDDQDRLHAIRSRMSVDRGRTTLEMTDSGRPLEIGPEGEHRCPRRQSDPAPLEVQPFPQVPAEDATQTNRGIAARLGGHQRPFVDVARRFPALLVDGQSGRDEPEGHEEIQRQNHSRDPDSLRPRPVHPRSPAT